MCGGSEEYQLKEKIYQLFITGGDKTVETSNGGKLEETE